MFIIFKGSFKIYAYAINSKKNALSYSLVTLFNFSSKFSYFKNCMLIFGYYIILL